MHSIVEVLVNF